MCHSNRTLPERFYSFQTIMFCPLSGKHYCGGAITFMSVPNVRKRLPTDAMTSNTTKVPRVIALSCIAGHDNHMLSQVAFGAFTKLFTCSVRPFFPLRVRLELMSTPAKIGVYVPFFKHKLHERGRTCKGIRSNGIRCEE